MRTTVDIPDPVYRELKIRAATDGVSIKEIILESLTRKLQSPAGKTVSKGRARLPVIRSNNPGSLRLGDEGVYEYIPFP
jgi:plasmid stability protein